MAVCCVLGIAVLAAGMLYQAKTGKPRGGGADSYQVASDAFAALSGSVKDKSSHAVDTAAKNIKKEQDAKQAAAKKAREKQAQLRGNKTGTAKSGSVSWNGKWEYAGYSKIHTGQAMLYKSSADKRKEITVAVNAGHGTRGGNSVRTQCHPDGSPKVVSGSTPAGSTTAAAVSSGTTLLDGTSEGAATLAVARAVKEELLAKGYDVLMLRDAEDVQLDNIARTVMANNLANCHISIHYNSSENGSGLFYISVPDVSSYRSMEPVASHWREHEALGQSLVEGTRTVGVPIKGNGSMAIDLTQTSYSTIPSVDLEVGDRASDHSSAAIARIAKGITAGVDRYF